MLRTLTVLALSASALALPLEGPAHAATTTGRTFVVVDSTGPKGVPDGLFGLSWMPEPSGPQTVVVPDNGLVDVSQLTVSADGSRIAYVLDTYDSASASSPSKEQIVVRDAGGQLVRVVTTISPSTGLVFNPSLSPDGRSVVWTLRNTDGFVARRADVGTGATTTVAKNIQSATYVDSATLIGVTADSGQVVTLPAAGGTTTPVSGVPANIVELRVSPAGNQVLWTLDKTARAASSPAVADVQIAPLDLANHKVGTATTLATGQDNHSGAFARDGSTDVYYIHDDGTATGSGDVKAVDAANPTTGTPPAIASTPADEQDVITGVVDTVPPGNPTAQPATIGATSATLHWTLPSDPDLSGVQISRSGETFYVPAPLTSATDTGLASGTTYTYTITAVDRSGNAGPNPASVQVTPIAAGATFASPTSTRSATASFPVRFATSAPTGSTFDVQYSVNGGAWKTWVTGDSTVARTFGAPAATNVAATTSTPGSVYRFLVTAHDGHGNSTPPVTSGAAVVPFDQTKATYSGGANVRASQSYLGTMRQLRTRASYARLTVTGRQVQVIGLRCPSCGKLAIYEGRTLLGVVDTGARSVRWRSVLFTKTYSRVGSHSYVLRSLATKGRPSVDLDAFAVLR